METYNILLENHDIKIVVYLFIGITFSNLSITNDPLKSFGISKS